MRARSLARRAVKDARAAWPVRRTREPMASCYDCGAQVADEDRFCGNCGIALRPGGAAAQGEGASSTDAPAFEPSQNSSHESSSPQAAQPDEPAQHNQSGEQNDSTPAAQED